MKRSHRGAFWRNEKGQAKSDELKASVKIFFTKVHSLARSVLKSKFNFFTFGRALLCQILNNNIF